MELRVDHLRALLANVSSETLTGARLNRIQKQMAELGPALDTAVAPNSPEAEELGAAIGPRATKLKEAASAVAIRAERVGEQLEQLDRRLDKTYGQMGEIRQNANELMEMSRLTVERIGQLRRRFETQGPLEMDKEELRAEAETKLALIRQLDEGQREAMEVAREKLAKITETLDRIEAVKERTEELGQTIGEEKARLEKLRQLKGAFEEELLTVAAGVSTVKKVSVKMNFLWHLKKIKFQLT
jgi:DNA repair exonuclease SbcCD ATPase subunit